MKSDPDQHTARAASEAFAAALAGDRTDIARFLHPEFRSVRLSGQEEFGPAAIALLEPTAPPAECRDYGDLALLTGREPAAGSETVTVEIWVRTGGSWTLLLRQLNPIATADAPSGRPVHRERPPGAPPARCPNPVEFVPYTPASEAERELIRAFQQLEAHVVRNEAEAWVRFIADEFVVYRTGQHPTTREERAGHLREQAAINAEIHVAEVEAMTLWMFGDAAVMRADHVMPGNRRPPYRATRVFVRRDGRWQMAISQQTTRA